MVVRPPVNEVVISIAFQSQPVLESPKLVVGLGRILEDFPSITEVPPYEMPMEKPLEEHGLQASIPQIQFVDPTQLRKRYWLTAGDSSPLLIQVQADYFALNWRRKEAGEPYPGYDHLRELFDHYLGLFQEAVVGQKGDQLTVTQLELTYINILRPDESWGSHRDLSGVINLQTPGMDRFEQLNFAYSRTVTTESGSFYGRLHAAVATGYQPKSDSSELRTLSPSEGVPVINLSITTRSTALAEGIATVGRHFDIAHDAVTGDFNSLTTGTARSNWGLL
jgi:uncharacterized protein (TIGR04255 family)